MTFFKKALITLCIISLVSTSSYALNIELPELGNSANRLMTPKQERQLGQAFMRSVRRNQAVLSDLILSDYIQELGQRLVKNSDASGQDFHFFLIDNPQINAFAGPAGHIGVYTGLIATTETESVLAAVVAHEIAHVSQQHLFRAWETAQNMAIPNAAVLIAAIALGVAVGGDAGVAAAAGGQAAILQEQINFTRANEQEADRVGIDVLAESGFSPNAMPAFFSRMGKANRVYDSKLPEFLMTHPVSTNRTAESIDLASRYPYIQNEDSLRYHLVKSRLRVEAAINHEQHLVALKGQLEDGRLRLRDAKLYEQALTLLKLKRYKEAQTVLRDLIKKHPDTIDFVITLSQLDAQLGDPTTAFARLDAALQQKPLNIALNTVRADMAMKLQRWNEVIENIERLVELEVKTPSLFSLLSRAYGESGQVVTAHRYKAEAYYLNGQLEEAIAQLDIAMNQPRLSFYENALVDSRRKLFKAEKRALDDQIR